MTPGTAKLDLGSGSYETKGHDLGGGLTSADVRAKTRERPVEEMLNDPLREVTRKERRSLLGLSALALLIGWTDGRVVPSKLENVGITGLTASDRRVLLSLFFGIVSYFFITFIVYAATDFLKYFHTMAEGAKTLRRQQAEQVIGSLRLATKTPWWLRFVVPASLVRGVFDFFITLAIAGVAMWSLWGAVHQVATTTQSQPPAPSAPSAPPTPAVAPAVPHGTAPSLKTIPHR